MNCQHDKYTEKRFAVADIERIFNKKVIRHLPIKVYFCEDCKAWHITTPIVDMANKILELTEKLNNQPTIKATNKGLQVAYDKLREKHNTAMFEFKERENNMSKTIENLRNQIENERNKV